MTVLRTVFRGGFYWLVADVQQRDRVRRVWLHKQAKAGECFRPGQKMRSII
jgi:hypothetical protein